MNYVSKNVFTCVDMSNILTRKRRPHKTPDPPPLDRGFSARFATKSPVSVLAVCGVPVKMGFNIPAEYRVSADARCSDGSWRHLLQERRT